MITVISGTNREGANSLKVARQLESVYHALGEDVTLLDLRDLPTEAFAPTAYGNPPANFRRGFIEPILQADGLHMITPEYNGSFPGVLKYLIDLLPFPEAFEARPVAFIGLSAGRFGALRPVEQLQMVFGYRNAHILPQRLFISAVHESLQGGDEIVDVDIVERLRSQAEAFKEFVRKLKA